MELIGFLVIFAICLAVTGIGLALVWFSTALGSNGSDSAIGMVIAMVGFGGLFWCWNHAPFMITWVS